MNSEYAPVAQDAIQSIRRTASGRNSPGPHPTTAATAAPGVEQEAPQQRRTLMSTLMQYSPWYSEPVPTPGALARRFVARLRAESPPGAPLPVFLEESYMEALLQGERQFRPVLIFLHSRLHQDAQEFILNALTRPEFVEFVSANFIVWGGCVQEPDGFDAAGRFDACGFPFLGLYSITPDSTPSRRTYGRLWSHEGCSPVQELIAAMRAATAGARRLFDGVRDQRRSREYDRELRAEQERAFAEAEAADRARLASRDAAEAADRTRREAAAAAERAEAEAEVARQAATEEAQELEDAIRLSQELDMEAEAQAAAQRLKAHPEPPPGGGAAGGVASLRFALPNGAKLQRRFSASAPLSAVRDFLLVASAELGAPLAPPAALEVSTNLPRRTFRIGRLDAPDAALDLRAAGLFPQAMLYVSLAAPPPPPPLPGTAGEVAAAPPSRPAGS